ANLNQSNAGIVETLKDGSKLWRVGIKCPGAFSVNLIFDEYRLPEGAYLYIYNKDRSYVIGPYTSKNNTWDNIFGSDIVPGEEIVVEYYEPFYAAFPGQLKIGHVTHGYRDPFKMAKGFNDSGNCHNNSICPVGADWQDEKRSVAILLTGGNAFCTGAMVGNATLDGTPYFLTADHCLMPPYSAWVFRFNYESSQCTPSLNGPTNNVVTGAVLRANYENSDVALLELNSPPNPAHQVYYAGWNKENTPASAIVGIHHPSGDIKKISFDDNTILSSGYFSSTGNDHWTVNWDNGVTEGGSSGSPIFDQNHRIVGQLHGGPAACGGSDLRDYYGKFSTSWTGGGTNSSRLSNWLDPANTGIAGINGYYPSQPTNALDVALVSVQQPSGSYCTGDAIEPVITLRNDGTQTLTSVVVSYTFDNVNFTTNTYTVNIPMFGLYNLTLPAVSKPSGSYTFNASLSNPNGGTDQNNANNAGASAFSMVSGGEVTFELRTDDYPNETSYIVTGPSGDTLLTSEPFASPNTVYSTSMCMAAACYNFKIFDSYGDGICCSSGNGYFKV
ncbi:MAG TPA: serine protease, partial [Chitinophagales bacterium]|nr:serine protease [Chitinophagales bacterium]